MTPSYLGSKRISAILSVFTLAVYSSCSSIPFQSAEDATYRYLESKQRDAYLRSSSEQRAAWDRWRSWKPDLTECDATLMSLPESLTWVTGYPAIKSDKPFVRPSSCDNLRDGLTTRYEALSSYIPSALLLEALIQAAQDSRKENIAMPKIRLGTLPTLSINAQTYAVPNSPENIIVLNKGALELASRFTEAALSTIWVRADDESEIEDTYSFFSDQAGLLKVPRFDWDYSEHTYNDMTTKGTGMELQGTPTRGNASALSWLARMQGGPGPSLEIFVSNSLLSFLRGEDISEPSLCRTAWGENLCQRRPFGAQKQRLLTAMVQAMGLFILGHEIGHILRHHSPVQASGTPASQDLPIVQTWGEEIAADEVGAVLMLKATHDLGLDLMDTRLREYQVTAPLLFLEYVRLVDEARYAVENKKFPPKVDKYDVADALSAYEEARATGDEKRLHAEFGNYPPTWFRKRVLEQLLLSDKLRAGSRSKEQEYYLGLGIALQERIQKLAFLASFQFAEGIFSWNDLFRKHPSLRTMVERRAHSK